MRWNVSKYSKRGNVILNNNNNNCNKNCLFAKNNIWRYNDITLLNYSYEISS